MECIKILLIFVLVIIKTNIFMGKFNTEQIQKMIELWNSGMSCTKIGKEFNATSTTISKYLKENGVEVKNRQNEIKFDIDKAVEDYQNGMPLVKVCEKYQTTYTFLKKHLDKRGIQIVNAQNRTKFDETVFDNIDTEEKAYWLGFIFADGNIATLRSITKPRYGFELGLQLSDYDHLKKFNKFMKHEDENHVATDSYRCRWIVSNKHLWETLNSYGCTPRKSLTLKFPDFSIFKDKSLIRHFIRGYFDGDGSLGVYKNDVPSISLLGTKDFLTTIQNLTLDTSQLTINNYAKNPDSQTYILQHGSSQAVILGYTLYYKSNIYLDRKYQKFLQFQNCRFNAKALELLEGKIGEGWDVNPELIADLKDLQQCNA